MSNDSRNSIPGGWELVTGALMVLLGGGITVWLWYSALSTQNIHAGGFLTFPCFVVIGIALLTLPPYEPGKIPELEEKTGFAAFRHLPKPWKIATVLGVLAGVLNLILVHVVLEFVD